MGEGGGVTGGVEFEVFVEIGVAKVALWDCVSEEGIGGWWGGGYLCIYVDDDIVAAVCHACGVGGKWVVYS